MKDQRFFPYKPCPWCKGDHPNFHSFHDLKYVFKHWPASDMENFCLAVEAEEDEWGRVATHTSFMDCNYTSIRGDVPPKPCTWLFLVGASEGSDDERILEIVKSWARPAKIETGYESRRIPWGLSYGPVLYEGYSYSERAYAFRLEGTDKLRFKLTPIEKVINPVIKVENWTGEKPKIFINGEKLAESIFRWQFDGRFLIVWINGEYVNPTDFAIE